MIDTLKTSGVGVSGSMISCMEIIPPALSALTALATLIYMILKIKSELKKR